MEKHVKVDKTICILLNRHGRIYYSNIDRDAAEKWVEESGVIYYLPADDTFSFNFRDTIDKFALDRNDYYLVIIQSQDDVYEYAYKDLLTSLYNRNYWEQLKSGVLQHPMLKKFALVIIDIDNLKSINDSMGHLAGDKAIWIVGKSIRESIRKQDIAVRYGGDEFFVLIANTKRDIVEKVIERIKKNIREKGMEENVHIEISAGMACSNSIHKLEKVITMADYNLYKEKIEKKVRTNEIGNELEELKYKLESLRDKLDCRTTGDSSVPINKELLELSIKIDKLITKYSKSVQKQMENVY